MKKWVYDRFVTREYINDKFIRYVPKNEIAIGWTSIEEIEK